MSIEILNKEEKEIVKVFRHFNVTGRRRLLQEIEKIMEEMEDAEDVKDVKKLRKEATIPAAQVYKQLGI